MPSYWPALQSEGRSGAGRPGGQVPPRLIGHVGPERQMNGRDASRVVGSSGRSIIDGPPIGRCRVGVATSLESARTHTHTHTAHSFLLLRASGIKAPHAHAQLYFTAVRR